MNERLPLPAKELGSLETDEFLRRVNEQESLLTNMPLVKEKTYRKNLQAYIELPGISGTILELINSQFEDVLATTQQIRSQLYDIYPANYEIPEELVAKKNQDLAYEKDRMLSLREIRSRALHRLYNGQSDQMRLKAESLMAAYFSSAESVLHGLKKSSIQKEPKPEIPDVIYLYTPKFV